MPSANPGGFTIMADGLTEAFRGVNIAASLATLLPFGAFELGSLNIIASYSL